MDQNLSQKGFDIFYCVVHINIYMEVQSNLCKTTTPGERRKWSLSSGGRFIQGWQYGRSYGTSVREKNFNGYIGDTSYSMCVYRLYLDIAVTTHLQK